MRLYYSPARPLPTLALLLGLALTLAPAAAHDIVLLPQPGGGVLVRYGHPQDWLSVDAEKLLDLQAVGALAGSPVVDLQPSLKRQGLTLLLPAQQVPGRPGLSSGMTAGLTADQRLLAARYDNGLWARLPAASAGAKPVYRNTSRWLAPGADDTLLSLKYAKAWRAGVADAQGYRRPVGHLLELVPQRDPLTLKAGELLPVQVLLQGQPLAGAGVELSDLVTKLPEDRIARYTTDAQGMAQLPLRARGIHMLGVDLEQPNDGSLGEGARSLPVDKLLLVATYTFVR